MRSKTIAAVCFAMAWTSARAGGAAPLLSLLTKPTVTLCVTCISPAVRVEIKLRDGVTAPDIRVQVDSIQLNGGYDQQLQGAFAAHFEPAEDPHPTAIVLEPARTVDKTGVYD